MNGPLGNAFAALAAILKTAKRTCPSPITLNKEPITLHSPLGGLCAFAVQTLSLPFRVSAFQFFSIYLTLDPFLGYRLNVSAPKSLSPIRNFPFTNHP